MSWEFVPSDNFDVPHLLEWQKWYRQDLQAAQDWYDKVANMPTSFPGRNWTLNIATDDLKISRDNMDKINEALRIAKEKESTTE